MPIIKSKKKSVKQTISRKLFNDKRRGEMRGVIKEITELVGEDKFDEAKQLIPKAYKTIDKAKKRGVIKPNNAARKKSRISRITKTKEEK